MEVNSYFIPDFMREYVQERITKLNKSADKLSCPRILYHETGVVDFREVDGHVYKFVEITLAGEAPKLNGWKFIGVIQHTEFEGEFRNIMRMIEGEAVPETFRYTENKCDHCMFIRNRNDTYLVQKDDLVLQVGSTCLKDFTGHKNPHAVAAFAEDYLNFLRNLEENEDFNEFSGSFGRNNPYYKIEEFLYCVRISTLEFGWKSKSMIQRGEVVGFPTSEEAWNLMTSPASTVKTELFTNLTQFDLELISNALAWIRSQWAERYENNDYMWNLVVACAQDYITKREAGLVASLLSAYSKYIEKMRQDQLDAQRRSQQCFVGEIGKRINLGTLTLLSVIQTEGMYGTTFIHKLVDCDGNIIVWFTGSENLETKGEVFTNCIATVKDHKEFRGDLQTVVTRMKWTNQ